MNGLEKIPNHSGLDVWTRCTSWVILALHSSEACLEFNLSNMLDAWIPQRCSTILHPQPPEVPWPQWCLPNRSLLVLEPPPCGRSAYSPGTSGVASMPTWVCWVVSKSPKEKVSSNLQKPTRLHKVETPDELL
jgi:hypothetical protein